MGTITATGVAILIVKETFTTVRTIIANRNGAGEIKRAERLATLEEKVHNIERIVPKIARAVSQTNNALRRKGWIK